MTDPGTRQGFRERRSTVATRLTGFAAYACAFEAVVRKQVHYWDSAPRWDLIIPLASAGFFGLLWLLLSHRAPQIPVASSAATVDKVVMKRGPALPTDLPGPSRRLRMLRGASIGLLLALAGSDAVVVAMGPDGDIGRQAGEIARHGGVVRSVVIAGVDGDSSIHSDGKGSWRWVSTIDVVLPGTATPVHVVGAMTRILPFAGDSTKAFYAPGDPGLGAIVRTNIDGQFDGRPTEDGAFLFCVVVFSVFGIAAGAGSVALFGPKGGERLLRDDLRAGRARAVRALVTGSTRTETIASGSRIGSEKTTAAAPLLTITPARGNAWKVSPFGGYDPSVIADDFAGVPGWIVWPQRYRLFQEANKSMPLAFIADDGRMFWAAIEVSSYSSSQHLEEPTPSAEQITENPRPPLRIPRYGRYHPVLHGVSALALGVAGAVAIWRLSIYPATLTSWLMWPAMMVLPWLASYWSLPSARGVKTQRRILSTVSTTVVDKVPRS